MNTTICNESGDQATPKIASTSDGGCYIMWFDNRVPNYKVYVNQDGIIDGADLSIADSDAFNFVSGYVASDVNGDNIVDGSDLTIINNNAYNFVTVAKP